MSMSAEIAVTCARELRRNLRSAKGLVSLILFLMGGGLAVLVLVRVNRALQETGLDRMTPEMRAAARETAWRQFLTQVYEGDQRVVDSLVHAPPLLYFLYGATLVFLPMLVILIGYDQTAADLQYRTLRYTTVRSHRASLVVGKALAVWLVASAISLVLYAITWVTMIARGDATAAATLSYGVRFWCMTAIFAAAYAGLTALVSSFFKTPVLALLTTIAVAFGLWIIKQILTNVRSLPEWVASLRYAIPGTWEPYLLSPRVEDFGLGTLVCVGFGALCTAAACFSLAKRDV
jgi:Cu-processing system permease protein